VGDAFIGYQDDTPAAVVFQVTHLLKSDESDASDETLERWKAKVGMVHVWCIFCIIVAISCKLLYVSIELSATVTCVLFTGIGTE